MLSFGYGSVSIIFLQLNLHLVVQFHCNSSCDYDNLCNAIHLFQANPIATAGYFHVIPAVHKVKELKLYPGQSARCDLLDLYTDDELAAATEYARQIPIFDGTPKMRMSWTRYTANAKKDDLSFSPAPLPDHMAPNERIVAGDNSINVSPAVTLDRIKCHYRDTERVRI